MCVCVYIHACIVMSIQITLWFTYFHPEEFSLTLSCKADLLAMDSLRFYFSGNAFYFLTLNFEKWFCWVKDTGWWGFFVCFSHLSTLNISFHCLLAPLFLMQKQLLILVWFSCTWLVIFLFLLLGFSICLSTFFYCFVSGCGPLYTILLEVGWNSWMYRFVFLIKFEKLPIIISSIFFFLLFSPSLLLWFSHYVCVIAFKLYHISLRIFSLSLLQNV